MGSDRLPGAGSRTIGEADVRENSDQFAYSIVFAKRITADQPPSVNMHIKDFFIFFYCFPFSIFRHSTPVNIQVSDTIDSIVSKNLKAARVLSKHGIDFYSEGTRSLKEACREANISFGKLSRQIRNAEVYRQNTPGDLTSLEIDKLTRFIEKYHHHYTYDNILFIKTNIARLVRIFGKEHPELEDIHRVFLDMTAHLTVHMNHEEHILFPYIRKMVKQGKKVRSDIFRSVKSPIAAMMTDHDTEHVCLKKLDDLTHHYVAPRKDCTFFSVIYRALGEFEKDLHDHIRLENEILFPKALEMESRFNMAPYRQN